MSFLGRMLSQKSLDIYRKIQQQLQPVNNPTGNAARRKLKIQAKTQTENLVVAQGSSTTTDKRRKEPP
jgi:hypothetical protein